MATAAVSAIKPLDEYVSAEEPDYGWYEVENSTFHSLWGGTGHVLNVTSQTWLDESKVYGPDGSIWTHQVVIVVPKHLKYTNVSMAYLTGGCNDESNMVVKPHTDEDVLVVDEISHNAHTIAITVKQIPNCPLHFPDDPRNKSRSEDAILAQAWHEFLKDPKADPKWLPRLPMVKAGYQAMRAAQEFLEQKGIAKIDGWVVAGASKRGWTTWDVGAANCETCKAKILGLVPLVPIVPDIQKEVHQQWQSYNGFTWAFYDYTLLNITQQMDDPKTQQLMSIIDPDAYFDRLAKLPKYIAVTSDDEFMSMDWTQIYYDKLQGEKHLLIIPNAEHSMASGLYTLLSSMGAYLRSIAAGHTAEQRPNFTQHFDNATGQITVTVPKGAPKVKKVKISYGETLQDQRRDFRWIVAKDGTNNCSLPYVPVPGQTRARLEKKYEFLKYDPQSNGDQPDICIAPILWKSQKLRETSNGSGVYVANAPLPKHEGRWVGYYVNVYFEADTKQDFISIWKNEYHVTTKGWTYPNTLPYPDCHGEECIGRLV